MDGKMVIVAACNNGTSALVTREGELYIFGKDSTYCDSTTGYHDWNNLSPEMKVVARYFCSRNRSIQSCAFIGSF